MEKIRSLFAWFFVKKLRLIAVFAVVLLAGFFIIKNKKPAATGQYQTATVEKGTVVSTVSASGKVLTTNTLSISTEASGVVKKVYVADGDKVVAGQKLAEITLDSAGLEKNAQAYASLISAQNSVNSANNVYRSAQASAEKVLDEVKGHDTDETLAQKETRTKAEVARDNAYDQTKSAQANLTSSSLNYRSTSPVISAPFSGIVESVNLVEGMVLESSTSTTSINSARVAVIKGDSLPVINVTLSELDVPKVKVGQKVTVTLDSISDKTFTGVVATIDRVGTVSSNVTSYSANIKLDSSDPSILPNMAATASIILETKIDVLKVPSSAVTTANGESFVTVVKDGVETQVSVTIGISSDSETEIVGGLSEGDVVVSGSAAKSSSDTSTQTRSVFSTFGAGGVGGGAGGGNARFVR